MKSLSSERRMLYKLFKIFDYMERQIEVVVHFTVKTIFTVKYQTRTASSYKNINSFSIDSNRRLTYLLFTLIEVDNIVVYAYYIVMYQLTENG